jgi:hypothetical protein
VRVGLDERGAVVTIAGARRLVDESVGARGGGGDGRAGAVFFGDLSAARGAVVGCAARCVAPELLGDIALRSACLVGGG